MLLSLHFSYSVYCHLLFLYFFAWLIVLHPRGPSSGDHVPPGSLPLPVSGLWGDLCHYSSLSVIISVPHQSEFLKATHLFFAFLLP